MDADRERRRAAAGGRSGRGRGARQTIAVGETYDFAYQRPDGRKTAWLEVRTTGGKWQAQGHVVIK